jgi:hypothetical protein
LFDLKVIGLYRPGGLGSFLVNGTKGLLGKILMETRYHIREFGSHRRDPLYGSQSRGPQVSGGVDTRRDFGGDFRGGRVLQASLNVSKEVQHEFNGLVDRITLVCILNVIVKVQQEERNPRVRVDMVPVRFQEDFVIFDDVGFPDGWYVTRKRVVLSLFVSISNDSCKTIEMIMFGELEHLKIETRLIGLFASE